MFQSFVFNVIAITVRHWYEVHESDEEHGTRIELRERIAHPHRGSESASQVLELGRVLWRADLFDLIGEKPGSMTRAHHHVRFDTGFIEPIGRDWNDDLSADPFIWTERCLGDLEGVASAVGVAGQAATDAEEVRQSLSDIMTAARCYAPELCTSPQRCMELTRDTTDIVRMMTLQFRNETLDPRLAEDAALKYAACDPIEQTR